MEKLDDIISSTNSLVQLIQKSGDTITKKDIKNKATAWVQANFNNPLIVDHSAQDAVKSLAQAITNRRLRKRDWLSKLRQVQKGLFNDKLMEANSKTKVEQNMFIFEENKPFTAYLQLKTIFTSSHSRICILDSYVEEGTLDILVATKKSIELKILVNNTYNHFMRELPKFEKEFSNAEVRQSSVIHERFFIIDGICYIAGHSLHAMGGSKTATLVKLDCGISNIFESYFSSIWSKSRKI